MTAARTTEAEVAVRRGPGRPRDEALDEQIVEVVLALIDAEEDVTVSKVVSRSGISRAALYRRWSSLTALIAASLDVGRVMPPVISTDGDLREAVIAGILGDQTAAGHSDVRFRHRIRLVMADRDLQKTYWSSHVARRRIPMETALRDGIRQGILRRDIDVEACFDAMAGTAYYQLVVRGDRLDAPETRARVHAALDVVWRGMLAHHPAQAP